LRRLSSKTTARNFTPDETRLYRASGVSFTYFNFDDTFFFMFPSFFDHCFSTNGRKKALVM